MQIVIDIPEEYYKFAKECESKGSSKYNWGLSYNDVVFMIAKGTPLPKGHGRLIDADALLEKHRIDLSAVAPTIVEADKENS